MKERKLTEVQKNEILNYGNSIRTLSSFAEACRKMPGMYLGSRGTQGWLNMNREIFQNQIDQMVMINGIATKSSIVYDELNEESIMTDNGNGIPFGQIIKIFTAHHTGKNYDKKPFDFSAGLHGSGAKGTCACSEYMKVESFILGEGRMMEFEKGIPMYKEEKIIKNPDLYQGTRITFKVDRSIMGDCDLSWDVMFSLFSTMLSLTQIGTELEYTAIPKSTGIPDTITFVNKNGILYDLTQKTQNSLIKPIIISKVDPNGIMAIDIALTYDATLLDEENISAFANWSPTIGGTHVDGFLNGLCKFFRDYMNKVFLKGKKNAPTIINADIKTGLNAIVHAKHLYPDMKGQSKEELNNEDIKPFIANTVIEQLETWSKENPKDLQTLCGLMQKVASIREKEDKSKEKITNEYSTKDITSLPPKYKKPAAKKKKGVKFEFWIVEGDSAGGSAANGRNQFQGILPIKGKMPNAFLTKRSDFLNNEEVKAFFAILGTEPGKNFDIEKVLELFDKIIIGVDADVDGLHIASLVLSMCLKYALPLIEHGLLFRSEAPLFSVKKGKKNIYYTDNIDYIRYVEKLFLQNNVVQNINGTALDSKELEYILQLNANYTYLVNQTANNYSINPSLLEDIIFNIDKPMPKLTKIITKKYQYLSVEKKQSTTIFKGLVGNKIDTVYFNDRFRGELVRIQELLNKNKFTKYKLNGEDISLFNFMTAYESYKPPVQRYKGLGEMNAEQLSDSVLEKENRTLVQYTVQSAKEEIERIRYYESNKYELIKGASSNRSGL